MDEATMAGMFSTFESHKPSGYGLGLTTVRNIIDRHDARVAVQSTVSQGTTMLVVFPCPETPEDGSQSSSNGGRKPPHIADSAQRREPSTRSRTLRTWLCDGRNGAH